MRKMRTRPIFALTFVAALAATVASCKVPGKPQPFTSMAADVAELRAAFNADAGKVRLIVLVSPT